MQDLVQKHQKQSIHRNLPSAGSGSELQQQQLWALQPSPLHAHVANALSADDGWRLSNWTKLMEPSVWGVWGLVGVMKSTRPSRHRTSHHMIYYPGT